MGLFGFGGSSEQPAKDESAGAATSNNVYVLSKEHSWVPARLLETDGETAKVVLPTYKDEQAMQSDGGRGARGKTEETVKLSDYPNKALPLQNVNEDGKLIEVEDMVDLPFLHEAAILYNLKSRHTKSLPYTRTGDIVIAVNPYKWITDLYTEKRRTLYSQKLVWEKSDENTRKTLQPHVYEVSALAYRGLAFDQQDQSILVSGESGAGKTETVKICMNHIASVQRGVVTDAESSKGFSSPVVQRVLDSNPLLEAFGNAKTTRNDNSSRFGKYIQLQFDGEDPHEASLKGKVMPACTLAGSKCDVYLLEKSRVVGHEEGERSFHIFYQLLAAPDKQKAAFWDGLEGTDNESFSYVGWTDTTKIEGKTDAQQFEHTVKSLELIGVKDEKLTTLMRSICVVLQLGNLMFAPHPKDSEKTAITSTGEFAMLSKLLGISPNILIKAFTERTVEARGETYKTPVNSVKAKDACDALAKEIYARTFLWLVREINDATCAEKNYDGDKSDDFGIIGLLDIFGFESFKINRFEQLCINYANEKLQQKFTQDIFATVQEEYQFEGIDLEDITYDDNTDVLDLIEGRGGLVALLNEECFRPNGNDATFVNKAIGQNKNAPCLIAEKIFDSHEFGIQHYAGPVKYFAEGFVGKNTDTIPSDLKEAATSSSNYIIAHHLSNDATMNSDKEAPRRPAGARRLPPRKTFSGGAARKSSNIVGETVWTKFKTQLNSLMENLSQTRSRYIRCIKPNVMKKPCIMQHNPTVEQLRCAGVVAAITISRSTFPNRLDHQVVMDRFKSLWPKGGQRSEEDYYEDRVQEDVKTLLGSALRELEVQNGKKITQAFVIGKTRAYFRAGALEFLETKRMDGMGFWAAEIQRICRGFVARRRYQKQRKAAVVIGAKVRAFVALRKYRRTREAAIRTQCFVRCVQAKTLLAEKRIFYNASKIQCRWRILKAKAYLVKHRKAAIAIQKIARGAIQRPRYAKALQEKKEEADLMLRLEKMQRQLEEAEQRRQQELETAQENARKQLDEERKALQQEREVAAKAATAAADIAARATAAATAPAPAAPAPIQRASTNPQTPSPPPEQEVRVVEVVKYVEKEKEDTILTEQQQALMAESGKIIEFLRAENLKLRKKSDQQKKDFARLKENNLRLMEANASAGASFQALNQHAKQLNGTNQKLVKTVAQYKNKITQLHSDMKTRQAYYNDIVQAYSDETEARSFYEKTVLEVVDVVSKRTQDKGLIKWIMTKASECAHVSKKVAGAAPDMDDTSTSDY